MRQRRVIVAVDEIMEHAGMVGELLADLFEDGPSLQQFGIGLVARQRRLIERQRVKDGRLGVVRILLHQLFHCLFVSEAACRLVDPVVVLVIELDRREPVALPFCLGADRLALLDRLQAVFQHGGGKWQDQRVGAVADRNAPVGDGALRIGRGRFGECPDAVGIDERMHERDAAIDFLLRLRRAGGLERHAAELLSGLRLRRDIGRRNDGYGERARQQSDRVHPCMRVQPCLLWSSGQFRLGY
jgi:hypothetical protein